MEKVICIVEDAIPAGFFNAQKLEDAWAFNQYSLFFTSRRIIAAVIRSPSDSLKAQARARELIKHTKTDAKLGEIEETVNSTVNTTGIRRVDAKFRGVEEIVTAAKSVAEWTAIKRERKAQFKGKTLNEILHLHPDSFEIPYENIRSIKLKRWSIFGTVLEIKCLLQGEERKFKFRVPKSMYNDLKGIINQHLEGKTI